MTTTSDRLRKRAKNVIEAIHKMNDAAKAAAQEKLQNIREKSVNRYEEGRDKVHRFEAKIVQLVRRRPLRFALIATCVKAVLGGFWHRRLTLARVSSMNKDGCRRP